MGISHQIPVVPITFYDNKQRFPFRFFSGSPGPLRTRVHSFFSTVGLELKDRVSLRKSVYKVILESLLEGPGGLNTASTKKQ
jgi:1-acyl-sn-glycerol-3-phosphate acyltransferase